MWADRGAAVTGGRVPRALGLVCGAEKYVMLRSETGIFPDPGKSKVLESQNYMLTEVLGVPVL